MRPRDAIGILLPLWVAAIAGCATPEEECREGIGQVRPRVEAALSAPNSAEGVGQVNEAYAKVRSAEDQLASKDYQACKASIGDARALLNRSQRTN